MTTVSDAIDVPAGLKGVVVAETALGDVRGREGFYHYRQYSAVELAQQRGLEDVWHLMFEGALPDPDGRAALAREVAAARHLPAAVRDALPAIAAAGGGPLDGLRTALSLLGSARGLAPVYDVDPRAATAGRAGARRRGAHDPGRAAPPRPGRQPLEPRDDLGHAAGLPGDAHRRGARRRSTRGPSSST